MIIRNKFNGYVNGNNRLYPGGGGPSTTKSETSNIPDYARPYVERMMGSTEKQIYTYGDKGQITGFQPYKPFEGETVAGFTPMQKDVMQGIAGYQLPGQTNAATQMTERAGLGSLNASYDPTSFQNQYQAPGQYASGSFGVAGVTAPNLQQFQMGPASQVAGASYSAPEMQTAQTAYNPQLQQFQMGPAERVGVGSFNRPGTAEEYMSPYQQAVTDIEKREATRSSNIMQQQQQAQAVQQGAFGGSRSAIVEAERQRNLGQQLGDIQARGSQFAFQQAREQFNAENLQAGLQAQLANQQAGLTTGGQNLQAQLGIQQLGTQTGLQTALANLSSTQQANVQNQAAQLQTQGLNADQAMRAALANQQAGLTVGQQNLQAQLGTQQLGAGQDLQAQLANQQYGLEAQRMGEQSRQFGYGQDMTSAQLAAQYGTDAQRMGEQSRQFGADLGMRGYSQGLQAAGQLGALGQQQYGQEMGLLGQQYDIGSKQQAYEQQRLNQIIQDYATQQQYPFIQLGTLSNMLRGLPMQASTTQMYQAQPPMLQQAVGLAGAGANLYQAMKAEGGAIKEMASGGIASGVDPYKLPGMMKKLSDDQLSDKVGGDTDPETMGIAQAEKQRRDQIRAGKPKMMAGGGAVAFAKGGIDTIDRKDTAWAEDKKPEEKAKKPEFKEAKKEAPAKAPPVSATPYQDMARSQFTAIDAPSPELDSLRKTRDELEKRTAGGVEGEMDRQQKLREKFGVDPAKLIAEERARYQEELKLNQEDYRKAEHLRYAQMFAKFGSTPGPVLKAALVAINDTVPDLLEDKAKVTAVRREIGKAMHELNKQEYQEKKGNFEAANKSYEDAVGKITNLNMDLRKMVLETGLKKAQITGGLAEREMASDATIKSAQLGKEGTIGAARIREQAQERADKRKETADERKEKERVDRNTTAYGSALDRWKKDSGYNEERQSLQQQIATAKDEKVSQFARDRLRVLEKEREDIERSLGERYPDARTGSKTPAAPSGGDVDRSNPLLAK